MSLGGFVWGITWNKYTQGSLALYLIGSGIRHYGWSGASWAARGVGAGAAEVYASGFFGHQARAIGSLAVTTPGQVFIGAGIGYGVGLGSGYLITKELYGQEGADLFLDVMTPGGDVGILTKEAWTEVIGPSVVEQAFTMAERKREQTLKEVLQEEALKFALGPIWGPAYGFFKPKD